MPLGHLWSARMKEFSRRLENKIESQGVWWMKSTFVISGGKKKKRVSCWGSHRYKSPRSVGSVRSGECPLVNALTLLHQIYNLVFQKQKGPNYVPIQKDKCILCYVKTSCIAYSYTLFFSVLPFCFFPQSLRCRCRLGFPLHSFIVAPLLVRLMGSKPRLPGPSFDPPELQSPRSLYRRLQDIEIPL